MYAINTNIAARTNDADRRIATGTVNGNVALVSRLKRKWHSLQSWFSRKRKPFWGNSFREFQATMSQHIRLALSGATCPVAVHPPTGRPVPGVDLRRTRLRSLAVL